MLLYYSLTSARIFFRYDAPDPAAAAAAAANPSGPPETGVAGKHLNTSTCPNMSTVYITCLLFAEF